MFVHVIVAERFDNVANLLVKIFDGLYLEYDNSLSPLVLWESDEREKIGQLVDFALVQEFDLMDQNK